MMVAPKTVIDTRGLYQAGSADKKLSSIFWEEEATASLLVQRSSCWLDQCHRQSSDLSFRRGKESRRRHGYAISGSAEELVCEGSAKVE